MDYFGGLGSLFPVTLGELSTLTIAQAFLLAGALLVAFVLLMALAVLASRWLSHSLDSIFEWVLLLALGAAMAWLVMQGFDGFW